MSAAKHGCAWKSHFQETWSPLKSLEPLSKRISNKLNKTLATSYHDYTHFLAHRGLPLAA